MARQTVHTDTCITASTFHCIRRKCRNLQSLVSTAPPGLSPNSVGQAWRGSQPVAASDWPACLLFFFSSSAMESIHIPQSGTQWDPARMGILLPGFGIELASFCHRFGRIFWLEQSENSLWLTKPSACAFNHSLGAFSFAVSSLRCIFRYGR